MTSPRILDELKKLRKANNEMHKRLKELREDDHDCEQYYMKNGHCAICGEHYRGN